MSYDHNYQNRINAKRLKTKFYSDEELNAVRALIKKYFDAAHPSLALKKSEAVYAELSEAVNEANNEQIITARYICDLYNRNADTSKKNIKTINALVDFITHYFHQKEEKTPVSKTSEENTTLLKDLQKSFAEMSEWMKNAALEAKKKDEQIENQLRVFQQKRFADEEKIKQLEEEITGIIEAKKSKDTWRVKAAELFKQRNYSEYQKTLDHSIKTSAEGVAETYFLKAKGYEATLQYSKALQAYQMAQQLQPKNPEYLFALSGFSILIGDFTTPIKIAEKLLTLVKTTSQIAKTYNIIGNAWFEKDDYKKAAKYFDLAYSLLNTKAEEKNPLLIETLNNLGLLHHAKGEYELAINTFQNAINKSKLLDGKENITLAKILNHQGLPLTHTQQFDKAIKNYNKSIEITQAIKGKTHPIIANALTNLGEVYRIKSQYETALDYYTQALKMNKLLFKGVHPKIAGLYNNIGMIWERKGNHQEAISYYNKSIKMNEGIFGNYHILAANAYNNLGLVHHFLGDNPRALESYQQAISVYKKIHENKDHPDLVRVYTNMGGVYHSTNDFKTAIQCYTDAVEMNKRLKRERHESNAYPLANLARVFNEQKDYDNAISYYNQAYKIFKKLGPEHVNLGHIYNNLGETWKSKGDSKKAVKYYQMAITILTKVLGRDHFYTQKAMKALSEIH